MFLNFKLRIKYVTIQFLNAYNRHMKYGFNDFINIDWNNTFNIFDLKLYII